MNEQQYLKILGCLADKIKEQEGIIYIRNIEIESLKNKLEEAENTTKERKNV